MQDRDDVQHAAELIRAGRLVGFPTETVYGLGANALDADAVARIFAAKRRPASSPLIVHVSDAEMAREVVSSWPDPAEVLTQRYWPGPLTLVLPKRAHIPDAVTAGLSTVGVRVPAHPLALALVRAAGVPIAAPSANPFTALSPVTAEHVRQGLGEAVDFVLDGGPSALGIESTVLSLADSPVLLRRGMVTQAEIERLIGPVAVVTEGGSGAHAAPGLHRRHYCPVTPLIVGEPPEGRGAWVFWHESRAAARTVRLSADARNYARELYSTLHQLDREKWDWIAVEPVPDDPEWAGIHDRLRRASTKEG